MGELIVRQKVASKGPEMRRNPAPIKIGKLGDVRIAKGIQRNRDFVLIDNLKVLSIISMFGHKVIADASPPDIESGQVAIVGFEFFRYLHAICRPIFGVKVLVQGRGRWVKRWLIRRLLSHRSCRSQRAPR